MEDEELIGPDLILMLLSAPTKWPQATNRINGITRLEKMLFLIQEECQDINKVQDKFDFIPYDYGPFSKEVYEAVELLEEAGLLEEKRTLTEYTLDRIEELLYSGMTTELAYERHFYLTETGKNVAEYLAATHPKLHHQIKSLKDQFASMRLQQLIFYVYDNYPCTTKRSVIRNKVLGTQGRRKIGELYRWKNGLYRWLRLRAV